jgi:hypothetical protein
MVMKHGVQEGSITRTILFLLYINELPLNILGAKLVLLDDDINLLVNDRDSSTHENKIIIVIEELNTWFHKVTI